MEISAKVYEENAKQKKLYAITNSEKKSDSDIDGAVKETKQSVKHFKSELVCSDITEIETTVSTNLSKTLSAVGNVTINQQTGNYVDKDDYKIFNKKINKKIQHLSWNLGSLQTFKKLNIKLEQYATSPEIAAGVLHIAQMNYCDISGKVVADLGCGCGVLTIGAHLLDADLCIGIDICENALEVCQENISNFDCDNVELVQSDVISLDDRWYKMFDTVIMNPPFGTKGNKGIDIIFLKQALLLAETAVYSFHKTATRKYIQEVSERLNVKMEPLYKIRFDLPKTYARHVRAVKDIEVDLLRFSTIK